MTDVSKYIFTYPYLVKRYQVPYTTIKRAVENLDLGIKLGRWRFIAASELGELEIGIRAIGHRLPRDLPPIPEEPVEPSLEVTS